MAKEEDEREHCKHCGACDCCDRCAHCGHCRKCGRHVEALPHWRFNISYPYAYPVTIPWNQPETIIRPEDFG